ncbi:unnamed protein product [Rotaria socialis]|uniref:Uncharacterized protein n=1 Tax=Rotaria socialis TaxID=392032 RepID=A0A818LH36_9BILA|nr:unnamed protein product [Rotaria socialis]
MATMNYCLTVCRAAEEKHKQKIQGNSTKPIDIPKSTSDKNGIQLFRRFFSLGSEPNASTSFKLVAILGGNRKSLVAVLARALYK